MVKNTWLPLLLGLACTLAGCGTTGASAEKQRIQQCNVRDGEIMEGFNRAKNAQPSVSIEGKWKCDHNGSLFITTIVADSDELVLQVRYRNGDVETWTGRQDNGDLFIAVDGKGYAELKASEGLLRGHTLHYGRGCENVPLTCVAE